MVVLQVGPIYCATVSFVALFSQFYLVYIFQKGWKLFGKIYFIN